MSIIENSPILSSLLSLLQRAQAAVPAVRYAVGIVGVAAASAIVYLVLGHTRASILSIVLMFGGMILLFLFARLVSTKGSSSIQAAVNVVLWSVVLAFAAALVL